jgi:hypothetical protein
LPSGMAARLQQHYQRHSSGDSGGSADNGFEATATTSSSSAAVAAALGSPEHPLMTFYDIKQEEDDAAIATDYFGGVGTFGTNICLGINEQRSPRHQPQQQQQLPSHQDLDELVGFELPVHERQQLQSPPAAAAKSPLSLLVPMQHDQQRPLLQIPPPEKLVDTLRFVGDMLSQHLQQGEVDVKPTHSSSSTVTATVVAAAAAVNAAASFPLDESYMRRARSSWEAAKSEVKMESAFDVHLVTFHSGFNVLQRAHMRTHIEYFVALFKKFASLQPEFIQLGHHDQTILVSRNAPLFVQYILGRYFGAKSGREQLAWMLNNVVPRSAGGRHCGDLAAVPFKTFNELLTLMVDKSAEQPALYEVYISRLAASSASITTDMNYVVALACLYSSNVFSSLENQHTVQVRQIAFNSIQYSIVSLCDISKLSKSSNNEIPNYRYRNVDSC